MNGTHDRWWETRGFALVLCLWAIVPLVWPTIPPLVDLPGHMGRYAVQLNLATSPALQAFYGFEWQVIGNLGVDHLIVPMAQLFGVELGTKLIVMAIPALTVGGLLWIAREVHGEVPPTALFALPLAYGHPFLFGFVNFALAMALALCAFALWLRMGRLGALRLRAIVFVPISIAIWLAHAFGWGTLGVLAFSGELIRQHDMIRQQGARRSWPKAIAYAGAHCLALALPAVMMVAWRSGAVSGGTEDWFNWAAKAQWLAMTLRDRWQWFDTTSLMLIFAVLIFAAASRRLSFSRNLAASALLLAAVFVLLPRIVFGSAYADMRLTPYVLAIGIVAIRMRSSSAGFAQAIAVAGVLFFSARTLATTASFAIAAQGYERALPALDHVPRGARLVSFVGRQCRQQWSTNRMEHLPALAIVRRHAFSNDQWDMAGAQLLTVERPEFKPFDSDPSQIVTRGLCRREVWRSLDWSLANLPRRSFDYVWLIDPVPFDPRLLAGMTPVWSNGRDALYRIER